MNQVGDKAVDHVRTLQETLWHAEEWLSLWALFHIADPVWLFAYTTVTPLVIPEVGWYLFVVQPYQEQPYGKVAATT
jgi:hypothetical protein